MKKRLVATISAICVLVAVLTAFTACDGDKLFESSWEAAVVRNAQGDIVACGEDFSYDDSITVATVTCTVSVDGEIKLTWAEGKKSLTGKMTEISEGADKSQRYSVAYSDGSAGIATYLEDKDAVYPSDTDKDDAYDLPEKYELTLTVGDEYILYFVRVSQIK